MSAVVLTLANRTHNQKKRIPANDRGGVDGFKRQANEGSPAIPASYLDALSPPAAADGKSQNVSCAHAMYSDCTCTLYVSCLDLRKAKEDLNAFYSGRPILYSETGERRR